MPGPATLSQTAIFREITPETVKRSEMPPDAVKEPKLPEAPAAAAAPKGKTEHAQPQVEATISPPPSRSIWRPISRIFQ
jgi:hypothetical protein